MDAKAFYEQVVRLDKIADLANQFVLVHLDKIQGLDLRLFDFDYDLTFAIFLMNGDEHIYGRYGGRDAKSAERRMSLAGLRFAMQAALAAHKDPPKTKAASPIQAPVLPEQYSALRAHKGCIHCHQIWEARRHEAKLSKRFNRAELWVYPLPENVGIALDVDQGNKVSAVTADSPAGKLGIRAGDSVQSVNGVAVASFADAQYGLHRAGPKGPIPIAWQQDGKTLTGLLEVADGWRKTNPTWRPSMLDILPAISLYGEDLTPAEKKAVGLAAKRLAFRQDKTVHKDAQKLGVLGGDIIIGINNETLEMSMLDFLGYVRRNFLVGERITLNIIRNGKRIDLTGQL